MSRGPNRLLAPCLGLLLSGCVATQRDLLDLSQQQDELKLQVLELKKSVSSLQANQADLTVKMDQVHADLGVFTETMKDSQASMGRLSAKLDDLQAALDQKMSGLGETLSRKQEQLAAQFASQQAASKGTGDPQPSGEAEKAAASAQTPGQLFHSAQIHLSKRNYALASQGFEAYLQKYPKGEVADLAAYYLGESYYGLKEWEKAAKRYALLLDRHPRSDMVPSARLKYASCLINLKTSLPEAKRYLESVSEDFPKSPEASAAQKLLKRLAAPAPALKPPKR